MILFALPKICRIAARACAILALPSVSLVAQPAAAPASNYGGTANRPSGYTPTYAPAPAPAPGTAPAAGSLLDSLPATDPGYQLSNGDEVIVSVYGEDDISTNQRIDSKGIVRIPLIGDINLNGKTVREAENYLEKVLVDKKILRKPLVSISVRDYAVREVSILGAVNSPGKYRMPKEAASVEIVELITSLGGFKPTARADEVKITRVDESGIEIISTVDVEAMITGRGANRNTPKSFLIYPGDRIYVPERLF